MQSVAASYGRTVLVVAGTLAALAPDPFGVGGVLSKALDLLRQRSDEAVTNTENCRKLLEVVNWSRKCLTGAPEAAWAAVEEEKSNLKEALEKACVFLKSFGISNFWDRLVCGRAGLDMKSGVTGRGPVCDLPYMYLLTIPLLAHSSPPL